MDVLPAPFGPIRLLMAPFSTVKDTSEMTLSPPKRRVSPATSSRATA